MAAELGQFCKMQITPRLLAVAAAAVTEYGFELRPTEEYTSHVSADPEGS